LDKAAPILDELRRRIYVGIEHILKEIHTDTGLECFIIGGSWSSKRIVESLCHLRENTTSIPGLEPFHLVSNDIDIYHGPSCEQDAPFDVNLNGITKQKNEAVKQELNLVKCYSYSAAGFIDNNGINLITATCFEVDLPNDIFRVHVSPYFWEFAFSKAADRTIRVVDSYNPSKDTSTTCIRLAFKAFEMDQFKFDMEGLDPTNRTYCKLTERKT
jgi:hypothetical protein